MARLAAALGFPLGGEGLSGGLPWITNLVPEPGAENVKLLRPVRFSVRDAESFVDPANLLLEVGYARVHSDGEELFDELPRTRRLSLLPGSLGTEPGLELVEGGVQITRTLGSAQPGVYATAVDAGIGYTSAMVTAVITPETISAATVATSGPLTFSVFPFGGLLPIPYAPLDIPVSAGAVLGIEHGPRNKAIYLWLQMDGDGVPFLRLTGYIPDDLSDVPFPNLTTEYDWTGPNRYTMVWNEVHGYVEVYADVDGDTTRVFRTTISGIPEMPDDYFARGGAADEVIGLYGQEGTVGDSSVWSNIAVTTDVGYPILGNIRTGDFATKIHSPFFYRTSGDRDPRDSDIGTWFDMPESLLADPDPDSSADVIDSVFHMTKVTEEKTFAIYREDPALLRVSSDGFALHASVQADNSQLDSASTGTGFIVFDGQTVFQLILFDDFANKTVGLLKKDGIDGDINDHFTPDTPIDWSTTAFRLAVDVRANEIYLFSADDLATPVMTVPLDRATLPSAEDFGWVDETPFVAFGHITASTALGVFQVDHFELSHLYQAWDGVQGLAPTAADPSFTSATSGSPSVSMGDETFTIEVPAGSLYSLSREIPFSQHRGGAVEAMLRITDYRPRNRTGTMVMLDDGVRAYVLSFVDTAVGKFACLGLATGGGGITELAGKDGDAALVSFPVDWSEFHTYRIEKLSYNGVQVFLDGELEPRITYTEVDSEELPQEQYSGTPTLAFGQFSLEGATSEWAFVRGFFSGGYEISFKKNKPNSVLREELFDTQAIVVAYALDMD